MDGQGTGGFAAVETTAGVVVEGISSTVPSRARAAEVTGVTGDRMLRQIALHSRAPGVRGVHGNCGDVGVREAKLPLLTEAGSFG
jgi:hypothetical protein